MEHSLIILIIECWHPMVSLNPYSNGTLSDTLSESTLPFISFPFSNKIILKIRELVHLECYFRKCTNLKQTFQIKKSLFTHIAFISNNLHFRKRDIRLNKFGDLRKQPKSEFGNYLIMNTKYQRTKVHPHPIFANVITKTEKTNICELFHNIRNHINSFIVLITSTLIKSPFSQINILTSYDGNLFILPPQGRLINYLRIAVHTNGIINHRIFLLIYLITNIVFQLFKLHIGKHTLEHTIVDTHTQFLQNLDHTVTPPVIGNVIRHHHKIFLRSHHHFAI